MYPESEFNNLVIKLFENAESWHVKSMQRWCMPFTLVAPTCVENTLKSWLFPLHSMCLVQKYPLLLGTGWPPYPRVKCSKTYCGYIKLRIIPNAIYRVSREECEILRESVPYVKLYRYNPKHLYPNLNGYGDNGQRSLKLW